ncbi:hypothetical protein C2E23DRAFT_737672 [Lenzites betulinus]|nr:hypothetical protein C2E23DRAFT_737672 [Lenzites betulinus]
MFAARRAVATSSTTAARFYATASPVKTTVKLVAELRKATDGVSLTKAREALAASNNDLQAALKWLDADRAATGAAKVAKLADRHAGQGLVGVQVLNPGAQAGFPGATRAAMVELNCETDFVARNELFGKLLSDIAHTAAFLAEPRRDAEFINAVNLDALNEAPLLDHLNPQASAASRTTVGDAVRDLVTKVGERVVLRRAVALVRNPVPPQPQLHTVFRAFPFLHGSVTTPTNGTKGTLALLRLRSPHIPDLVTSKELQGELAALQRSVGRTIIGYPVQRVLRSDPEQPDPEALYDQPSEMFMDRYRKTVEEELRDWSQKHGISVGGPEEGAIDVLQFVKWSAGEPLENN